MTETAMLLYHNPGGATRLGDDRGAYTGEHGIGANRHATCQYRAAGNTYAGAKAIANPVLGGPAGEGIPLTRMGNLGWGLTADELVARAKTALAAARVPAGPYREETIVACRTPGAWWAPSLNHTIS